MALTVFVLRVLASKDEDIAYGRGLGESGETYLFVGDFDSMSKLKAEADLAREGGYPPPTVSLEPWQVLYPWNYAKHLEE